MRTGKRIALVAFGGAVCLIVLGDYLFQAKDRGTASFEMGADSSTQPDGHQELSAPSREQGLHGTAQAPVLKGGEPGGALHELEACCLRKPQSEAVSCVATLDLMALGAHEFAQWLCLTGCNGQFCLAALQATVIGRHPHDFFAFVDALQSECIKYKETPILPELLAAAESLNPSWLASVGRSVSPDVLFAANSEAPIQLAEYFVRQGDPYVKSLLEDGARGYFGGTGKQIFRAGLITAVHTPPGEVHLDFLDSLLTSVTIPPDAQVGCLLVQFFAGGKALVGGQSDRAVQGLRNALSNQRFAVDAANQLVENFDPSNPPDGFDPQQWQEIMSLADALADIDH